MFSKKIVFLLLFLWFIFPINFVEARSGCCSHHGGVCGCGCCDGTSLSAICAPYYPNCNKPVYVPPVATPIPTSIPTPKHTPKPTPRQTARPTVKPTIKPTPTPGAEELISNITTTKETESQVLAAQGVSSNNKESHFNLFEWIISLFGF